MKFNYFSRVDVGGWLFRVPVSLLCVSTFVINNCIIIIIIIIIVVKGFVFN
jgi:hypothetical protein